MKLRSLVALSLVSVLAACSADSGDSIEDGLDQSGADLTKLGPETDDDLARTPWETVGAGVSYKQYGDGGDVLIVYGGYTAQDVFVQRWTDEIVRRMGLSTTGT